MKEQQSFAPEFEHFYDYARQGELRFPKCESCGRFHWYPMKRCPHCRSEKIGWGQVRRNGTLFSWTVVRHAFDPAFADRLPYMVGLVEFDDAPGVRFVTNLTGADAEAVHIGMELEPVFAASNDPHPLVTFRPARAVDRA
ncbi:Zn-ribbon domain-containing OB-fold protein [Oceanibacterium hippocampi]|uniref:DUF35 domain-containing protein n=1 Tax=Oceanibacterium hippocampi TaxID=745714 RepID=A0A1Y5TT32_9PROT|nr:OB-fold domain-containing protein [Oceanibacterium hippocampi]SLN71678.1 hypothetical protein OCH7691_03391 [Oceanibacterium hippocampi]